MNIRSLNRRRAQPEWLQEPVCWVGWWLCSRFTMQTLIRFYDYDGGENWAVGLGVAVSPKIRKTYRHKHIVGAADSSSLCYCIYRKCCMLVALVRRSSEICSRCDFKLNSGGGGRRELRKRISIDEKREKFSNEKSGALVWKATEKGRENLLPGKF